MGYCAYCGYQARNRCMSCGNEICLSHQSGGINISDHHGGRLLTLVQFALANRPLRDAPLEFARSVQCNDCADKPHRAALAEVAELIRDLPPERALLTLVYAASPLYDHLKTIQQSIMEIWNTLGRSWPGASFLQGVVHAFRAYIEQTGAVAPQTKLQLTYWVAPGFFSGIFHSMEPKFAREEIACTAGWVIDLGNHTDDGRHPNESRCAFFRPDGQLYYGSYRVSDAGQIEHRVHLAGHGMPSRKEHVKSSRRALRELARHLSHDEHLDANIDCHMCEMGLARELAKLWWQLAHTTNR